MTEKYNNPGAQQPWQLIAVFMLIKKNLATVYVFDRLHKENRCAYDKGDELEVKFGPVIKVNLCIVTICCCLPTSIHEYQLYEFTLGLSNFVRYL